MKPSCKFYLEGRCQRGAHCEYSHTGPPIPLATAIKQPAPVPEFITGTVTAIFNGMKATFKDGLVPVHVDVSYVDSTSPRVLPVESSLRVTWYDPSRTVWLKFDSQRTAERARDHLEKEGLHNLAGSGPSSGQEGCAWTLIATGVRPEVKQSYLAKALPLDAQPKHMHLGPSTYGPEIVAVDEVRKTIRKHTSTSIIRDEDCGKQHVFKSCRAFFFEGNPDLDGLAKALDGLKVSELGHTRIWAQRILSLKLSLKAKVFSAKKTQFKSLTSSAWNEWSVKIKTAECNDRVTIIAFAAQRDTLSTVKAQIDELFSDRKTGIVNINLRKSSTQTHRVRLTKTAAYKHAKKVIDQATEVFGAEKLSMDGKSDPPAVLVTGDSATLRRVQNYLGGDRPAPKSRTRACAICLEDEVDDWVKLDGCGHSGWLECMVQYFTTDPSEGRRSFPLRCFDVECNEPLSLDRVFSLLGEQRLQTILKESLQDHIERHPAKFARCPGKDCSKVYHKSSEKHNDRRVCGECLTDFCAHCDSEYHHGLSCEEYQTRVVEAERGLERWMGETGAKRCPSCKAVVQKMEETCNNMECDGCKTHFCWACLETAPTHEGVYKHLTMKHGGWHDDEIAAWERLIDEMGPVEAAMNGIVDHQIPPDIAETFGDVLGEVDGNVAAQPLPPLHERHRFDRGRPQRPILGQGAQIRGVRRPHFQPPAAPRPFLPQAFMFGEPADNVPRAPLPRPNMHHHRAPAPAGQNELRVPPPPGPFQSPPVLEGGAGMEFMPPQPPPAPPHPRPGRGGLRHAGRFIPVPANAGDEAPRRRGA